VQLLEHSLHSLHGPHVDAPLVVGDIVETEATLVVATIDLVMDVEINVVVDGIAVVVVVAEVVAVVGVGVGVGVGVAEVVGLETAAVVVAAVVVGFVEMGTLVLWFWIR